MKKYFLFALPAFLSLSLLTGCGSSNDISYESISSSSLAEFKGITLEAKSFTYDWVISFHFCLKHPGVASVI